MRCGVWLLQWSLSQLLLLYKDVPQVFIYLQRKRRNEKGNEVKSQTSIWCTLKVNSESVLKTWKTGGDSKKAHIKQKIVCHHHLHPSTTEAKYKYTIEPIYRTRLNSDASTGLKVCFYCFQRIHMVTSAIPPRHCVPRLGATQRHNRQCFTKCVSVNKSCKVCIFPSLALKQTAHEFFQKGLWLMIRRSYIWWTLYWGLFYYFKEKERNSSLRWGCFTLSLLLKHSSRTVKTT